MKRALLKNHKVLTGLSIAGVLATMALTANAAPKAKVIMDGLKEEAESLGEKVKPADVINELAPIYAPAFAMGGVTIALIVLGHKAHVRDTAVLTGLYTVTEKSLRDYQKKVVDTIGDKKEKEIRDSIDKDRIKGKSMNNVIYTGKGKHLCYDSYSGREFEGDIEHIRKLQNDLNEDIYNHGGSMTLSDFYYELGLKPTKISDDIGWTVETGGCKLSFSSQLTDAGVPCLVINYDCVPLYTD